MTVSAELAEEATAPRSTGRSLLGELLARQQELSAVERFAEVHESGGAPAQERFYRDLLPATGPGPGEQYAFEVDLDSCSGCKACVAACHSLNGLSAEETWREVGLLVADSAVGGIQQHVTTACHHCLDPACLDGCPVNAYEKDPVTGIVHHLDDQCIGCRYCTLKCPYDVPKYDRRLGIVRKCDMCSARLAAGEAPACVQGCPNEAIRITLVDRSALAARTAAARFLPGAPEPAYTHPSTIYRRREGLPADALPADFYALQAEHAHLPLVFMLVLTQLSVGGFLVGRIVEAIGGGVFSDVRSVHAAVSLGTAVLAFAASTLHLGRPLYAWRAVIGLRTSWLSREIIAFAFFAKLAAAYAVSLSLLAAAVSPAAVGGLGVAVVGAGLLGVLCSVMVYHDTRRVFWRAGPTAVRFFLTTALLGLSVTLVAGLVAAILSAGLTVQSFLGEWGRRLSAALLLVTIAKLAFEAAVFRHLRAPSPTPMLRTATLMAHELRDTTLARFVLGAIGGIVLPAFFASGLIAGADSVPLALAVILMFGFTVGGELLERTLFFRAVSAPKMPGGVTA